MDEGADMSIDPNIVTPREMADHRPIENSGPRATDSERVVAWVCILASLFVIALMAWENHVGGGPLP